MVECLPLESATLVRFIAGVALRHPNYFTEREREREREREIKTLLLLNMILLLMSNKFGSHPSGNIRNIKARILPLMNVMSLICL